MKTRHKLIGQLAAAAILHFAAHTYADQPVFELAPHSVISQGQTIKSLSTVPQTVSIVDADAWDAQLGLTLDPVAALSQLVPSYSPSRQKMTGFGETFRGRSPLFLVDGIPQSNPLRDGSRDGYTIDSAMIERIEVIHGASAAQGLGATGGIINFITISPPSTDGYRHTLEAGTEISEEMRAEGTGYFGSATTRYREDKFGYAASISYKWRPMSYDGEGRLIGIDNTQGDTMNSRTLDWFGKIQYNISPTQMLEAMVNRFSLEQDMEYISVNGNPAAGLPTSSVKGLTPGEPTRNEVTSASSTYVHESFLGGQLKANLFYQDFAATYGGGTFGVFQLDGQPVFDQSQNESTKKGIKLSLVRDLPEPLNVGLVTGLDYIADETQQVLVQTNRVWVPLTTYESISPYLQMEKVLGSVVLSGGLRYEDASLDVGDFTTLEAYGSRFVKGGAPGFSDLLANLGVTWEAKPGVTLFASFNEGFGMPDVGRVLRGINQPDQSVDAFLNLQPVITENYEVGLRKASAALTGALSLFFSGSELGSRLVADADGIFSVNREKTETYGVESAVTWNFSEADSLDARFAWVEGKFDADGDGKVETRLDGTNIPPARLNLAWTRQWDQRWSTRIQSSTLFDRSAPAGSSNDFSGYTLIDMLVSIQAAGGRLDLGVSNLLGKQYITYYSQSSPGAARYFAGKGRTLNVRFTRDF